MKTRATDNTTKARYLNEIKTCHVFCPLPLPNVFPLISPSIQYAKLKLLQKAFIWNKTSENTIYAESQS